MIDYVASWADRLEGRIYEQFKDKPKIVAIAREVIAPQLQAIENAGQQLLTLWAIEDSEGVQLDIIGLLIGQPRFGLSDPDYRPVLSARIRANRSGGAPKDVYEVFRLLVGPALACAITRPWEQSAKFELTLSAPLVSRSRGALYDKFLGSIKAAGVFAVLTWQEYDDAHTFTMAFGGALELQLSAGATFVDFLTQASGDFFGFPATGHVVFDRGLPTEETLSYATSSGERLAFQIPASTAFTHVVGSFFELVEDAGAGFDDAATLAVASSVGAVLLTLHSSPPSTFPNSGTIVVDYGLPTEETRTFTRSGTSVTIPAAAHAHAVGAAIQYVGSTGGALISNAKA